VYNITKKPVSVLEIIGTATKGGMENQILNFLSHVSLDEFTFSFICPCESLFTRALRGLGARVFITPLADDPEWRSVQTAIEACHLCDVDVIHAHMPKSHVLAAIASGLVHRPVVATIHGMHLTAHELGVALACKSHLITNCQETYIQALALGIPEERVNLFPNGVDTKRFSLEKSGEDLRKVIGIPSTTVLIGFVGRLEFEKGPDLFLSAAGHIHQQRTDVQFAIVGAGSMNKELKDMALKLKLQQHLHFLEWSTELPEIYAAFDLIAHTSRSDGTSLVVLEAMSSGKPVIGMAVGGVRDIIENEHTGVLINREDWKHMGNEAIKLLDQPRLLNEMGKAGRIRVEEHFDVAKNAANIAEVLKLVAFSNR
jgi:glycosyltransferase involved in cell wall biosynthesis